MARRSELTGLCPRPFRGRPRCRNAVISFVRGPLGCPRPFRSRPRCRCAIVAGRAPATGGIHGPTRPSTLQDRRRGHDRGADLASTASMAVQHCRGSSHSSYDVRRTYPRPSRAIHAAGAKRAAPRWPTCCIHGPRGRPRCRIDPRTSASDVVRIHGPHRAVHAAGARWRPDPTQACRYPRPLRGRPRCRHTCITVRVPDAVYPTAPTGPSTLQEHCHLSTRARRGPGYDHRGRRLAFRRGSRS